MRAQQLAENVVIVDECLFFAKFVSGADLLIFAPNGVKAFDIAQAAALAVGDELDEIEGLPEMRLATAGGATKK